MTERLVVVGNGMASLRLLERLAHHAPGRYDVTAIGAEPVPAYNRVLLSSLLAGDMEDAACGLRALDWYHGQGLRLVTGTRVDHVEREAKRVVMSTGETLPYDRLVLATGSTPIRLPKPGADLPGIVAFRDLTDVSAMRAVARPDARAVVIGGGLLGLEAAYGLARLGVATTLLHVMDKLMERQLDRRAAAMVRRAMEAKGVAVELGADTASFEGTERCTGVRLTDGRVFPADLVVVAVGVRPLVDLARAADLAVERGIVVDDRMTTSDPAIAAVGECVQHRGAVYGLVEPGYDQAEVLARALAGDADAAYRGSVLATSLKVSGLPVFSAGEIADDADGEPILLSHPAAGTYRKLLLREDRLVGALLIGDVGEGPWYRELIRTGEPVGRLRHDLMFGPPPAPAASSAPAVPAAPIAQAA